MQIKNTFETCVSSGNCRRQITQTKTKRPRSRANHPWSMVDAAPRVMTIPSVWLAFAESPFQDGFAHIPWHVYPGGILALAYPATMPIWVKPPSFEGSGPLISFVLMDFCHSRERTQGPGTKPKGSQDFRINVFFRGGKPVSTKRGNLQCQRVISAAPKGARPAGQGARPDHRLETFLDRK